MPRKWTQSEYEMHYKVLTDLYVVKNKTIKEIGVFLGCSEKTIFKRLRILNIPSMREKKSRFSNKRTDVKIPSERSVELAELFGVLLGDGHVSDTQTMVTLGNKEYPYVQYVAKLFETVCGVQGTISRRATGYYTVYLGSVDLTRWLFKEGLEKNKVKTQVDVPKWIHTKPEFQRAFLRGFFDTDGSVYKLTFGVQISLTNYSVPILKSLQNMLRALEYSPSVISSNMVYLTKQRDVSRFFREIRPKNPKHTRSYLNITQ